MATTTTPREKAAISSGELGILWRFYQHGKMMEVIVEHFIDKSLDSTCKSILTRYYNDIGNLTAQIEQIFNKEGAVIPVAFGSNDIIKNAPPLFDDIFHISFLRILMKIKSGLNGLYLGMSYRKDLRDFFKETSTVAQQTYNSCTDYLLEKGVLTRPPYVAMPKEVEFIQDEKYMKGINLFGDKRSLNTVEVAFMHQAIETNIMGMQLMTGFAQAAKEEDVKDYFVKGKELSKKIVADISEVLIQSDVQSPATWAGKATDSTVSPFSDKLMMFCSVSLSSYALGSNALGTSFSLRSDLPVKLMLIMKDTYQYETEGAQLMIKYKWLEEPPQMEDRNQLIKSK